MYINVSEYDMGLFKQRRVGLELLPCVSLLIINSLKPGYVYVHQWTRAPLNVDGFMQKRRNSNVLAIELRLFPSTHRSVAWGFVSRSAPNHHINQFWHAVKKIPRNKLNWDWNENKNFFRNKYFKIASANYRYFRPPCGRAYVWLTKFREKAQFTHVDFR